MILVTGSTGNYGGALVEELFSLEAPVRAMVRTPEKAGSVEREGVGTSWPTSQRRRR